MKNSRGYAGLFTEWKLAKKRENTLPPTYEKTRQLVQGIWRGQATVELVDRLIQEGAEIEENVFFYKISPEGEKICVGGNALIAAAMRGDANMVRHLLSLGANPNSEAHFDSYTPLSAAAGSKDMETLRLLLEAGAKTTCNGASPLVEAAKVGWQEGVQCLLESGADVNEEGLWKTDPSSPEEEVLPLICAVHSGNIAVVDQLLDAGAQLDPEEDESMDSALTQAVRDGSREMVTHLLERGASLEESHTWWDPPLAEAIKCQDAAMVCLLLESGASVEKYFTEPFADFRTTPLCVAAMNEAEEVVRILIAAGAQVNDPTPRHTPLEIAASEGDVNMVRLLLELGADVNAPLPEDFSSGCTALMGAATSGVPEVVKLLLDAGAEVNTVNKLGATALGYACGVENREETTDIEIVKLLLDAGADVNAGEAPPLVAAAMRTDTRIVQLLLDAGAEINRTNPKGISALIGAVLRGKKEIVLQLLAAGANTKGAGKALQRAFIEAAENGRYATTLDLCSLISPLRARNKILTPALLEAVCNRDTDMAEILLDAGADVNACKRFGRKVYSPLLLAVEQNDVSMAELLLARGANADQAAKKTTIRALVAQSGSRCMRRLFCALDEKSEHAPRPASVQATENVSRPRKISTAKKSAQTCALLEAVQVGDTEAAQKALARGADPNGQFEEKYRHRTSLLLQAVERNDCDMVQLLLEAGANPNQEIKEQFPLVEATKNGDRFIVRLLLNAGADVNAHLRDRFNALETAASYGHLGIARLLIEAGAEPRPADTEYSPLRAAARAQYFHPELLRLLLTYYPDVRTAPHVHNALVGSIDERLTDATEILLAAGADPNAVGQSYDDDEGPITPLMAAISNDSLPAIRRLLAAGADPNKAVNGKSALEHALSDNSKPSVVRLLRVAGAH